MIELKVDNSEDILHVCFDKKIPVGLPYLQSDNFQLVVKIRRMLRCVACTSSDLLGIVIVSSMYVYWTQSRTRTRSR